MFVDNIALIADMPYGARLFISRLFMLITILVAIIVIRRVLKLLFSRPMRRLARHLDLPHDTIKDAFHWSIQCLAIALSMIGALQVFGVGVNDMIDAFIMNVARTFLILAVFIALYRLVDMVMKSPREMVSIIGMDVEARLLPFIHTGFRLVIIVMVIVIVLREWNYDVSGLIAGFGLGGLALALAAQDIAANLFGFMALVSDRPFDVGEFIITPDGEGVVEHVGLRSTRLRRMDQALISVPNSKMAASAIINWSRLEKRRLDYTLRLPYGTSSGDIRVLLHRIREFLKSQPLIDEESVVVYFMDFGQSSLEVLIRGYIFLANWSEFQAEKERLHIEVMEIVDSLGMNIAYPSMSLYLEHIPPVTPIHDRPSQPMLSPKERAIKDGLIQEKPESITPKVTDNPDENVTGQQDESTK
jgi:MscS family membrane protein